MKKLLFLISLIFVTTISANNLDASKIKLNPIKLNIGKAKSTTLTLNPNTNIKEPAGFINGKVGELPSDNNLAVEEVKYESQIFTVNKSKKIESQKGSFYIKDSNLPLPTDFKVEDVENDGGGVLEISWKYHSKNKPESFEILRKSKNGKFKNVKTIDASTVKYTYTDRDVKEKHFYLYKAKIGDKLIDAKNSFNKKNHFNHLEVVWRAPSNNLPKEFEILKKDITDPKQKTEFKKIGVKKSQKDVKYSFRDKALDNDTKYSYVVRVKKDGSYNETQVIEAQPKVAYFDMNKMIMLIAGLFLVFAIIFFIRMARTGKELYIRRIAGLDAVDDAVGRATEMGREIMFVPGITDIDDPQTIAGLTILGRVAKLTAQYKTPLSVPVSRSMVMITGREIVKESYLSAGRPENFQDGMIYYLTDDQFGFAAGVDGIMVREKPATIFLQGAFYAESLILAETGHHIGAIQISGTAAPSQLPFFITACDYTLMGEELYAASAYLSREPQLLGSLRGQDAGKALILVAIIVGIILETLAFAFDIQFSIKDLFKLK